MQADPDKWDDSELIAAVSRGLENLDAGAAAEDEDEMAEADARFAALLEAPVPATTPATAASPVKDPTVGEYGEWEPVQRPAAPPAAAQINLVSKLATGEHEGPSRSQPVWLVQASQTTPSPV